jgi:hypothetical protein
LPVKLMGFLPIKIGWSWINFIGAIYTVMGLLMINYGLLMIKYFFCWLFLL